MSPFFALVIASLLSRISYQMARSPVLPRFAQDLGATPELIGIIVAASTITGVFFKLPAGALSDVLGRKRMMLLGGLFFAGPPFLYLLVENAYVLLGLRVMHGFATAIFSPVASAYVASLAPEKRGARLGWFGAANDFGSTIGPLLGGLILFYTQSFDATYLLVGVIGILALALMFSVPELAAVGEGKPGLPVPSVWQGLKEVLSTPPVIIASCVEGAMYFGFGAFLGFFPIYAKIAALNDAQIAVVFGVQLTVAAVTKPLSGWASDRIGRRPVIIVGLLLCAISLPLIFRARDLPTLLALAAVLGLGVATVTPVTNALVADLAKERRLGATMGVFGTIFDIGEAGGPIVAGFLIGRVGYDHSFDVLAAIILAFLTIFLVSVRDPAVRKAGTTPR